MIDEGEAGEIAYYQISEPVSSVNGDLSMDSSTLLGLDRLCSDPIMRQRIKSAIRNAALAINFEGSVANHAERLAWAINALYYPEKYLEVMISLVCMESDVYQSGGGVTDSVIQTKLNSWINFVALNLDSIKI